MANRFMRGFAQGFGQSFKPELIAAEMLERRRAQRRRWEGIEEAAAKKGIVFKGKDFEGLSLPEKIQVGLGKLTEAAQSEITREEKPSTFDLLKEARKQASQRVGYTEMTGFPSETAAKRYYAETHNRFQQLLGQYGYETDISKLGGELEMIDPDGARRIVPYSDFEAALKEGYKIVE